MTGRNRAVGLGLLLVASLGVGLFVANRPPSIPADAASAVLDRTVIAHDHGQRCLDRTTLGSGWADVCWAVDRIPEASDNTQDDYQLRVYGSFEGLRWLVVRADLVGDPDGGAYVIWPKYPIEGACRQVSVHLLPLGTEPLETICGRTEGDLEIVVWKQRMTWTCEWCLLPDGSLKPLSMYAVVAVKAGTIPEWDVSVDGGS